ncbi:helix-turn-helix domain-containing protein [Janthinobacterium sp. B9-8]|uniref:helix-turn-helix domain-containing protein n=1 Tax=Janthinobacterium sp. B9-8 TaxID=1236179 RepID=UPI0009EB2502|nr:helix-turn-helix transcriptional regulator [Janthinobacterium sp. B9-8]
MNRLSVSSSGLSNVKQRMVGVSARLKEERKRLGLSQEAAAKALGISVDSLYGYEKNKTNPPISVLLPFSDIGADVQYIVTGERTAGLLSPEEQQMISALRAATPSVRTALLSMAHAGVDKQVVVQQKYVGGVGKVIEGDLTIHGDQTFKF